MMLFDFFKKLFGWADESGRKRRADDSSINIQEEDFIGVKRRRGNDSNDNAMGNRLSVLTDTQYTIEDEDNEDVKISTESIYRAKYAKKLLNRSSKNDNKNKSFVCCSKLTPTTNMNQLSKSSQRTKCNDNSMINRFPENTSPNISNIFGNGKCSTINKTHRLREKKQYGEMLQNFVPQRIQMLDSKINKNESRNYRRKTPEIIDLEKYELRQQQQQPQQRDCRAFNTFNRHPFHVSSNHKWTEEKRLKERITALDIKFVDQTDDRNRRKSFTVPKILKDEGASASGSSSTSSSKTTQQSLRSDESIVSNSLRDKLSSKAVMKNDYIPSTAKWYDARIQERNKEVEELKRITEVLSTQNRLAREVALEEQLAKSLRLCEAVIDDREEPEEAPLPVLTPQMLQEIRNALIPHPGNQVLVEGFGLQITRKDVHTLSGLNWLNDEVINFYMNLLIVRGSSGGNYPKVHTMNTFFYPKLLTGGHSSLKRWTRKVDIFSKDLLVVPIHLGMHWCMSIVDFRDKTIKYFDSMGGSNPKCLNALRNYLQDESLDKKKQPYDTSDWKLESVKDIPQQMNGSDCGVFSCMFAEYICASKRFNFTQKDMPYFRHKMVYEILKSKLL